MPLAQVSDKDIIKVFVVATVLSPDFTGKESAPRISHVIVGMIQCSQVLGLRVSVL